MFKSVLLLIVGILGAFSVSSVNARNLSGIQQAQEAFATSLVLSDSNMITFGIANFDPNRYLSNGDNEDNGIDNSDAIELRNQLTVYSVPYTMKLTDNPESLWSHYITLRASYVKTDMEVEFEETAFPDSNIDEIFGLYAEYAQRYQFTEYWSISLGNALHLMHYSNTHNYNSKLSNSYAPYLDGIYFNVSSNVFMVEPKISFEYKHPTTWGEWRFNNSYHYAFGQGFGGSANFSSDVQPEVWRLVNSVQLRYKMTEWDNLAQVLYLKAKRVDLGGDVNAPLGTDYYYEFNIAWLIDTTKWVNIIDNIGIGFTFNVGSALRGGSIVLFYDE